MNNDSLNSILSELKKGNVSEREAAEKIKGLTFTDLGYAKVDMHRRIRNGAGEVIYAENKTPEQILGIVSSMKEKGECNILITRLPKESYEAIKGKCDLRYDELSRVGIVGSCAKPSGHGEVLVLTAGTSDIPVGEEAALTAEFLGNNVVRAFDCGVAGLHRLLAHENDIARASVIIAIAGMEGALASVVGGLAKVPVIAVPTSIGYGASFNGLAALLSMLNSCASGVSVVNIDNGFGAGYMADMINHLGLARN